MPSSVNPTKIQRYYAWKFRTIHYTQLSIKTWRDLANFYPPFLEQNLDPKGKFEKEEFDRASFW
jgi:hypothetical protein